METEVLMNQSSLPSTEEQMLTTVDNPYDPFTEWDNWLAFDERNGYNTCGLLARIAMTSSYLSEEENVIEINHAIDTILDLFPGMYKVVKQS